MKGNPFDSGFETDNTATGERFAATDFTPFYNQTLSFSFTGGNLTAPQFRSVTVTERGKVVDRAPVGDSLRLAFDRRTLSFSGSYVAGDLANPPDFNRRQVFFRAFPNYGGYFTSPTISGRLNF